MRRMLLGLGFGLLSGCAGSPPPRVEMTTAYLQWGSDRLPLACHDSAKGWQPAKACPAAGPAGPAASDGTGLLLAMPSGAASGARCQAPASEAPQMTEAEARALLQSAAAGEVEAVTVQGAVRVDVDGDGQPDVLTIITGEGMGQAVTLVVRAGDPPQPVVQAPEYFALFEPGCLDLDGDGRPELLLGLGGETERSYALVEWDGQRLVTLGEAFVGE